MEAAGIVVQQFRFHQGPDRLRRRRRYRGTRLVHGLVGPLPGARGSGRGGSDGMRRHVILHVSSAVGRKGLLLLHVAAILEGGWRIATARRRRVHFLAVGALALARLGGAGRHAAAAAASRSKATIQSKARRRDGHRRGAFRRRGRSQRRHRPVVARRRRWMMMMGVQTQRAHRRTRTRSDQTGHRRSD
jgi:hypothetical protein